MGSREDDVLVRVAPRPTVNRAVVAYRGSIMSDPDPLTACESGSWIDLQGLFWAGGICT